jgi:hypothetical protein
VVGSPALTKVSKANYAILVKHDVGRLDIAMYVSILVHKGECLEGLHEPDADLRLRDGSHCKPVLLDGPEEVAAHGKLHHKVHTSLCAEECAVPGQGK